LADLVVHVSIEYLQDVIDISELVIIDFDRRVLKPMTEVLDRI
jgi:hypothetical protein